MKPIITFLSILLISFLSSPSWSETLTMEKLVENPSDGLVYKKFTPIPFSGSVYPTSEDPFSGSYKDGIRHGFWETFYQNGLLKNKGNYKDGKKEGLWEWYYTNGQLGIKGNYKDGKEEGVWEWYYENGNLRNTETYKNGEKLD